MVLSTTYPVLVVHKLAIKFIFTISSVPVFFVNTKRKIDSMKSNNAIKKKQVYTPCKIVSVSHAWVMFEGHPFVQINWMWKTGWVKVRTLMSGESPLSILIWEGLEQFWWQQRKTWCELGGVVQPASTASILSQIQFRPLPNNSWSAI